MHYSKIIGPYLLRQLTFDIQTYKSMLRYYGLMNIAQYPGSQIFLQDSSPAHTSTATREYLSTKLGSQQISKQGPPNCPVMSPDLTPLDFFLFGYMKYKVNAKQIRSLQHLKTRMTRAVRSVGTGTLSKSGKTFDYNRLCY